MKTNKSNLPKTLPFQGGRINQAGPGRAAGSINYVNHITGQSLDLFEAQVVQVGPIFALAAIAGNDALAKVRVDQALLNGSGPAQLGDTLIVGLSTSSQPDLALALRGRCGQQISTTRRLGPPIGRSSSSPGTKAP